MSVSRLVSWLVDWLVGQSVVQLAGQLVGQSVRLLVGLSVGLLVCRFRVDDSLRQPTHVTGVVYSIHYIQPCCFSFFIEHAT